MSKFIWLPVLGQPLPQAKAPQDPHVPTVLHSRGQYSHTVCICVCTCVFWETERATRSFNEKRVQWKSSDDQRSST